jgi:Rad3-related DNA helicase
MPNDEIISQPVFLALATTELNGEGRLARVSAERTGADGLPLSLERLVSGPRLSMSQARLTGLTNAQLDSAPDADEVLQDLLEFSAGAEAWIVANGPAARTALRAAAASAGHARIPGPPVIGLDELSAVVLPTVGRRGLDDLREHYGLNGDTTPATTNAAPAEPAPGDAPPTEDSAAAFFSDTPAAVRACYERLERDLLNLPLALLAEMNWLINKTEHPLKNVLKTAESLAVKNQFADTFTSGKVSLDKLFKDFSPIIERLSPDEDGAAGTGDAAVDAVLGKPVSGAEIAALLGPGGPLSRALDGYEERGEQIEMAQRVAASLSEGKHLLVEAGTGVGKSLAYLVPAILFAQRARRPVMIATHTKNLQSQLFHKDLPLLRKNLGVDFEAALLKGRPNYLCLRKFMYTLQESARELDDDERAQMLPIMTWAVQTRDGDVAELAAFSREQNYDLWDRLHTIGDDCLKRQCPFFNRCFVYKARGMARGADVVVLNHALVFADLNLDSGSLPKYREIIFDEAHRLEDVATEHLACEVTPKRAYKILNRLYRVTPGATAGKGLLPTLLMHLDQSRGEFPEALQQSIREHILNVMQAVDPANQGSDIFFNTLRDWTELPPDDDGDGGDGPARPHVPVERGRGGATMGAGGGLSPQRLPMRRKQSGSGSEERKRFSAATLRPDEAEKFTRGKEAGIAALGRLRQSLDVLEEDFKEIRKRPIPRSRELMTEIAAQNVFIRELIHDIEFVIRGEEPNYVYWSERWGRRAARVVAAPLDVAALLHEQLHEKKRSIIFASATLSVRDSDAGDAAGLSPYRIPPKATAAVAEAREKAGRPHPKSFEFLKTRLGLSLCEAGKLDELLLGSPFDYREQCQLYIPAFLPEPGGFREKEFSQALSGMLCDLVMASGGRALVLYTSYAALTAGSVALKKMLQPEGIEVLAQGEDMSRESLLARLKAGRRTVVLGTASFWEGVDVRGDALSLLVIAKLPFAVFTDPIVQGRCELLEAAGKDAFLHFSVPHAILKLRQGFGRLIRSKIDRGVVVLADKRVLTKRYGAAFLRALPAQARTAASQDALVKSVREFLGH